MAIISITPYLEDVSAGYVVTPEDWNGIFDNIHDYLNTIVKPAIDVLQSAPAPDVAAQGTFQARIGLEENVSVSSGDIAAGSTLYLNPHVGNLIGLYNNSLSSWANYPIGATPPSLAVPATTNELHDIWVHQSGGIPVLTQTGYKKVTATNSPTAGYDKVIDLSDTAGINVGDCVNVSDGSNSEEAGVKVVNTNTSITVDWLVNSYTTPTVKTNSPLTDIDTQDGVIVQDGDPEKRYAATIMTGSVGTVDDTSKRRGISNHYNRILRHMRFVPTGSDVAHAGGFVWTTCDKTKTIGRDAALFVVGRTPTSWAAQAHRYSGVSCLFRIGHNSIQGAGVMIEVDSSTSAVPVGSGIAKQGRHIITVMVNPVNALFAALPKQVTVDSIPTDAALLNAQLMA